MADSSNLIDSLIAFARAAAPMIPGGNLASGGIELGQKIVAIIDDLSDNVPEARNSAELKQARAGLIEATSAKARRTADRFDG